VLSGWRVHHTKFIDRIFEEDFSILVSFSYVEKSTPTITILSIIYFPLHILLTVTTTVSFTLPIIMSFMSIPSTLKLTVTSSVNTFNTTVFTYSLSPLKTSLLMCSTNYIHRAIYGISSPNLKWLPLHHLNFEE
jgi:hypothetical protein